MSKSHATLSALRAAIGSKSAFLALGMVTLTLASGAARSAQPPTAAQPRPAADSAARVERVLRGLRPKMEVEASPARWPLAERMAAYRVPAVSIAVVDGGRVVWAQGFGVKEVGGKEPVTASSLFQAASVSKAVSVSAMLRLVDKGTLSLDTNVNRYLTSWKLPETDFTRQTPVTLRRLATHSAGTTVSGFAGYQIGAPRPTVPELLDGKAPANNDPVRVNPPSDQPFRYSGGGTTIMQQLMIDVTGTPFPTLLDQQVFSPLGMMHSTFAQPLSAARAADAVHGHEKDVAIPGGWHVYPELAAAGLWTTPTDLATWAIAMGDAISGRSSTFLSRPTAAQIVGSAVPLPGRPPGERMGLGLSLAGSGDRLVFSHGGRNEGFVNELRMYAASAQGASIMINTGGRGVGLLREIQHAIAAEFGWPETGITRITTVAVDAAALDLVTGTYVFDAAGAQPHLEPRVVREGARLFFDGWGPVREELYPQSPTTFIGASGTRFSYSRDGAGPDTLTMVDGPRALKGVKK